MCFVLVGLRVVHVNRSSELISVFLAFPVLTSPYLAGDLAGDTALFLHVLPVCFFPTSLCKPHALFSNTVFCQVVF